MATSVATSATLHLRGPDVSASSEPGNIITQRADGSYCVKPPSIDYQHMFSTYGSLGPYGDLSVVTADQPGNIKRPPADVQIAEYKGGQYSLKTSVAAQRHAQEVSRQHAAASGSGTHWGPPPVTKYEVYGASNTPRRDYGQKPAVLYQGYWSSRWGNHRSLVVLGSMSQVRGKEFLSGYIEFDVTHTFRGSGATFFFGVHTHGSPPGRFSAELPNAVSVHAAVGNNRRVNISTAMGRVLVARGTGITVGPAPSNNQSYYGMVTNIRVHLVVR